MIAIINYGMGNLGSIRNMLLKIGSDCELVSDASGIEKADKIILPGVGAFDAAIECLERLDLIPVLNRVVLEKKTPILGICLGMQLMSKNSEEGRKEGLGWIDARTVRFRFGPENNGLKVPHMGWNTVDLQHSHPIWEDMHEKPRFYFVHSYHVRCDDESNVLGTTSYGFPFHSVIVKNNIIATQFHPEKSHKFGLRLLRNFVEAVR